MAVSVTRSRIPYHNTNKDQSKKTRIGNGKFDGQAQGGVRGIQISGRSKKM